MIAPVNHQAAIAKVYGPNANLYTDVLRISPTATPSEIREAFFCLRYDIYQKLDDTTANGGLLANALTSDERKEAEKRMEAITGAFQILSDGGRKKAYDASLTKDANRSEDLAEEEGKELSASYVEGVGANDMGFPTKDKGGPLVVGEAPDSPSKIAPSKSDNNSRLPIGQRRSVFRRRMNARGSLGQGSGMNETRRVVAEPVTGGLNERPKPAESADSIFAESESNVSGAHSESRADSIFASSNKTDSVFAESEGQSEGQWTDFGNNATTTSGKRVTLFGSKAQDDYPRPPSGGSNGNANYDKQPGWQQEATDESLPVGVNNMNAREQMLYKNQMYLSQQKQQQEQKQFNTSSPSRRGSGRLGSRYDAQERGDKYTVNLDSIGSPTGVEDFDNSQKRWTSRKGSTAKDGGHRAPPTMDTDSNMTEDDTAHDYSTSYTAATSTIGEEGTVDNDPSSSTSNNDKNKNNSSNNNNNKRGSTQLEEGYDDETNTRASSMYGDEDTRTYDTGTYDDGTSYADETTTIGTETIDDGTIGDSTWASGYTDDGTSYASNNETYENHPKYSPKHKKGRKPEPILKSGNNNKAGAGGGSGRRVTIHSHRGRGEETEDFSLFEGATCPLPSFTEIQEEVSGTYKDFTCALHQVSNAFVISPDDIDRLADKIRDAKIELGENYHKQMTERLNAKGNNNGPVSRPQQTKKVKQNKTVQL